MLSWKIKVNSLRCDVDPPFELLGDFLGCDLHDVEWANDLLTKISDVQAERLDVWHREGNAYVLDIRKSGATIQYQFDRDYISGGEAKESVVVPLGDLAQAVIE